MIFSDDDFQNFGAKTKIRKMITNKSAHNNKSDRFTKNDFLFGFDNSKKINNMKPKLSVINIKEKPKIEA